MALRAYIRLNRFDSRQNNKPSKMSIFKLDLALEIAILIFICIFGLGLVIITAILLIKCRRNKDSDLEVNRGQRVQEVSSIDIRVRTEVSRESEAKIKGGHVRSARGHLTRTSTYIHCPSPTYEPTSGLENPGFAHEEDDFINAIYSL